MITIDTGMFKPAYINIAVLVLYVIFMIRGAKRGLLMQVISALGTVVSFLAAWRYCSFASGYYNLWPKDLIPMRDIPGVGDALYSHLNQVIWFIALFIVIRLLFVILEKLCSGLSGLPVIKEVSGLLGGVLGLVSATVWVIVITVILNMPFFKNGKDVTDQSLLGTVTKTVTGAVTELAGPVNAAETISGLYQEVTEFGDQDKEAIGEWLSDHGINPSGETTETPAPEENLPDEGGAAEESTPTPAVEAMPDDPEAPKDAPAAEESVTTE
jgi:uncharacterized membrane protein required for colicin V production